MDWDFIIIIGMEDKHVSAQQLLKYIAKAKHNFYVLNSSYEYVRAEDCDCIGFGHWKFPVL